MVSLQDKLQMTRFITDRLEDAHRYPILEQDASHVLVTAANGDRIYVAAHHGLEETKADLYRLHRENREKGIYTAHVFYGYGDMFLRRLGGRAAPKMGRTMTNLAQANAQLPGMMINARDLEQRILAWTSTAHLYQQPRLVYYQPGTKRLPESLRIYSMRSEEPDHSHIAPGHSAFGHVQEGPWKDYVKAGKVAEIIAGQPVFLVISNLPMFHADIVQQSSIHAPGREEKPAKREELEPAVLQLSLF